LSQLKNIIKKELQPNFKRLVGVLLCNFELMSKDFGLRQ
jgi:hypothetical protein